MEESVKVADDTGHGLVGAGAGETPELWAVRTLGGADMEMVLVPAGITLARGQMVVIPTRYGRDAASVLGRLGCELCSAKGEIRTLIRVADENDLRRIVENEKRALQARSNCRERVAERGLEMSIISAHYVLDEQKVLFFFTADNRIDFRELVKDLVSVFRARIELRQVGVRDEARMVGGIGACGRVLCCNGVSDRLQSVSIKMAKAQSLSLSSAKVSGPCGRLLCCLAYEYDFYRDARRELPSEGNRLSYDGAVFRITEINVISKRIRIDGDDGRVLEIPFCRLVHDDGRDRWSIREECAESSPCGAAQSS